MTTRLAIIGTCASEDWVRYQNQRAPIDIKIEPKRLHSSIVSLFSRPVQAPDELGAISDLQKSWIRRDFDKSFLGEIAVAQPDYLLVDLTSDARDGVVAYGESWVTPTYFFRASKVSEHVRGCTALTVDGTPRRYLALFRESILALKRHLDLHLPSCRVILHKARFAESFRNGVGEIVAFGPRRVKVHRTANWNAEILEGIFEREIHCNTLALREQPVIADEQHVWGLGGLHFERSYYSWFSSALKSALDLDATTPERATR